MAATMPWRKTWERGGAEVGGELLVFNLGREVLLWNPFSGILVIGVGNGTWKCMYVLREAVLHLLSAFLLSAFF